MTKRRAGSRQSLKFTGYYEYILQISFYVKKLFWIPFYEEKILFWITEVQEPFVQSVPMRK
jgi:hypothetical protein